MKRALITCLFSLSSLLMLFSQEEQASQNNSDFEFLNRLRVAGVWDACTTLEIDFNSVFAPLANMQNNPYRWYRWSVSYAESGGPMINALPPEEEMGWTPWERWLQVDGKPMRSEWVQYPVNKPIERHIIPWYKLPESGSLKPRFLSNSPDLETKLRLARIDVASDWLGLDFHKTFVESMPPKLQKIYQQFRWVVVPHILAANGPVIYALPPMNKSDNWPWESWYTDGKTPLIHHIHYTKRKELTTGRWSEKVGAPQRPPEIYQHIWYWYDDKSMTPTLSE